MFGKSGSDNPSGSSTAPPVPDTVVDLNDASALDEKYGTSATVYCASDADGYLRTIAKYDFKWDDVGFLETKFDKYLKRVSAPGVLTVVSSKAKLQNGFGAYQHIELLCDYDTQAKKVVRYWVHQ